MEQIVHKLVQIVMIMSVINTPVFVVKGVCQDIHHQNALKVKYNFKYAYKFKFCKGAHKAYLSINSSVILINN